MELTLKYHKRVVSVSPVGCAAIAMLTLIAITVAALALLHFANIRVGSDGFEVGTPIGALHHTRESALSSSLLELSKRVAAAGHHGKYNLPSAPWLTECTKYYTRTEFEQELIVEKARQQDERCRDRSSDEQAQFVSQLTNVLPQHQDAWLPSLHAWLLPELDRLRFKARPVNLDCTKHAVVIVQEGSLEEIVWTVRHTFYMLKTDSQRWGLIIFHGPENGEELAEALEIHPGGAGEHIKLQLVQAHAADPTAHLATSLSTPRLLLSAAFWTLIPVEYILLLSADTIFMRPPASDLKAWMALTNEYSLVQGPNPSAAAEASSAPSIIDISAALNSGGPLVVRKSFFVDLVRSLRCTAHNQNVGECTVETLSPNGLSSKQLAIVVAKHSFPSPDQRQQFLLDRSLEAPSVPWFAKDVWLPREETDPHPGNAAVLSFLAPIKIRYTDQ